VITKAEAQRRHSDCWILLPDKRKHHRISGCFLSHSVKISGLALRGTLQCLSWRNSLTAWSRTQQAVFQPFSFQKLSGQNSAESQFLTNIFQTPFEHQPPCVCVWVCVCVIMLLEKACAKNKWANRLTQWASLWCILFKQKRTIA